jgi:hypothetical protein
VDRGVLTQPKDLYYLNIYYDYGTLDALYFRRCDGMASSLFLRVLLWIGAFCSLGIAVPMNALRDEGRLDDGMFLTCVKGC